MLMAPTFSWKMLGIGPIIDSWCPGILSFRYIKQLHFIVGNIYHILYKTALWNGHLRCVMYDVLWDVPDKARDALWYIVVFLMLFLMLWWSCSWYALDVCPWGMSRKVFIKWLQHKLITFEETPTLKQLLNYVSSSQVKSCSWFHQTLV